MIAQSGTRFRSVRSTVAAWIAVVAISCSIDTRGHTHSAGTHPPSQERLTVFWVLDAETEAPIEGATLNGRQRTDRRGKAEIRIAIPSTILIKAEAYAPHLVSLDEPDDVEQTIRLRRAVTLGGRVLNGRGSPIADAEVRLLEPRPMMPPFSSPDSPPSSQPVVTTDADGRWVCAEVPGDVEGLHIVIRHPDHASTLYSTSPESLVNRWLHAGRTRPISWARLRSAQAELIMEEGLTVSGVVQDPAGKPIAGATVRLGGSFWMEEFRGEVKTGADGRFEFRNGEAGAASITTWAGGYVLERQKVEVSRAMPAIRIQMVRGSPLHGRIIDDSGGAVVGADVTSGTLMRLKTDADGRFSWDSAAQAPFMIHVRADGYPEADELVEAGARVNVIRLRSFREIRVTGRVIDEATRRPVPEFQVLTSTKRSGETGRWRTYRKAAVGTNGSFVLTLRDSFPQNGTVVQKVGDDQKIVQYVVAIKIQAAGYVPDTSQTVAIENGDATVEVALVRGEGVSGSVTLPTGEPVPGARVILCSGREAYMNRPGHITSANDEMPEIATDSSGRFRFVPQRNTRALVVVHDKGFGLVPADRLTIPASVVLAPWGRVEGTLRFGRQPVPYATIMLGGSLPDATLPAVTLGLGAQTDEEGRFAFTRVPPGRYSLSRWQKLGEQSLAKLSMGSVAAEAGVTRFVELGGKGRPVVGRIVLSAGLAPVRWTENTQMLETAPPKSLRAPDGGPMAQQLWLYDRAETEEAKVYFRDRRMFPVRFAPDGSFRIEDVPAGTYWLKLSVPGLPNNTFVKEVVVPEMPGGRNDLPLDLGVVTVK